MILWLTWLSKRLSASFKTIADFRKDNGNAICSGCREFVAWRRHLDLFCPESKHTSKHMIPKASQIA